MEMPLPPKSELQASHIVGLAMIMMTLTFSSSPELRSGSQLQSQKEEPKRGFAGLQETALAVPHGQSVRPYRLKICSDFRSLQAKSFLWHNRAQLIGKGSVDPAILQRHLS
jgi:hypothetical protein